MCQLTLLPNVDPLRSQSRKIPRFHRNAIESCIPFDYFYQNSEFKSFFRGAAQHFKMYANTEIFNNGYEKNVI